MRALRHADQAGQITAFMAVFAVALFALAGLVIDGGLALSAHRAAIAEAEQAARAGADALSAQALRAGRIGIDPTAAVAAADASMAAAGHPGRAWVTGNTVTAQVSQYSQPTLLLGIVGFSHFTVSGTATATPVAGVGSDQVYP